ncbi:MAG: acetolactate synthase, large subunit, biosynthetic type [Treponema sp. CETP13]|nr:MAG: acetolactate synthase, large subunit, biosynthetic type [Treponema sp. CETP13]
MKISGAQIVVECLVEQGVNVVFGYPGGAILNIYDELYKNKNRIRHILTSHEQGASHAADGYSRSTGKTGVVLATSGPGATNLVTGIATAYMDSVPMVAITCNVGTALLGKDSFQEVDIRGITMPITKHSYIVRKVEELAGAIREAFIVAKSGRPGPVLIDIPKDITAAMCEYTAIAQKDVAHAPTVHMAQNIDRIRGLRKVTDDQLKKAAQLINNAQRPVIYAGGGVCISNAYEELKALAEKAQIPVAVSLMGKTAIPSEHYLCTGMIGMHGSKASNVAASNSDLLIAIGSRFSDRVISNPKQFCTDSKVLQIDIDPAEINKNIPTCENLIGDIKMILTGLLPKIESKKSSDWNKKIEDLKKKIPSMYTEKVPLHPKFVLEYVNKKLGDDTIITTEVGQHQMWAAQFYPFSKPRTFLTSGGLGTMGYGTGAAIGAQVGNPKTHVVHIAGDGSFRMNCNELSTISYYNLPIIIIVVNNGTLGMVRQWQHLFYKERYSETTLDRGPDFVKLADAYGIAGYRVANETEFTKAFDEAANSGKPAIIDAKIDIDEMVLPMVAPGKPIDQTLLEI